ncbi:unnamed protein product [Dibothriocephalus latus]|uniref:arginine--tRNA ligase n=1 Tax=Dibothriocephalus latus TaxID=60516 RepID=A0A3P7MIZ1_DIBLA|nr:unnamed protein product [Dibothriocephalus latus]
MPAVSQTLDINSPDLQSLPKYARLCEMMTEYENTICHNEQAIENIRQSFACHQICILDALSTVFDSAIKTAFSAVEKFDVIITPSTSPKFGDYQCNSAFTLAKKLSSLGPKQSPKEVSEKICECLYKGPLIEKAEVTASGFINIYISKEIVADEISKLVRLGFTLPPPSRKLKIIVDMSSPNIAKEMHVGHLR